MTEKERIEKDRKFRKILRKAWGNSDFPGVEEEEENLLEKSRDSE